MPLKIIATLRFISCPPEVGKKKKKKSTAKDPLRGAHRPVGAEKQREGMAVKRKQNYLKISQRTCRNTS